MASIVCIGIIGRSNNPLHISVLPPHENLHFKFSLLLNSCLDIIELRQQHVSVDQDLGLLHVLDERFAAYGWLTNTSVKFIMIVDMMGNSDVAGAALQSGLGLQQGDLKPAFQALQTAYIKTLQNPFYTPAEDDELVANQPQTKSQSPVTTRKLIEALKENDCERFLHPTLL